MGPNLRKKKKGVLNTQNDNNKETKRTDNPKLYLLQFNSYSMQ